MITIAVVIVGVALPALWVDVPAMTDYPNHLARMYLLVSSGTAAQNPYYELNWGFYPNLAMDILVPLLAHLVSVELATKFFYIFSALLVVTGSLAIEYQVKREIKLSPFTSLMFLNSWPFALGFLNFEFGLGLALWGIAAWLLLKDRGWSIRLFVHSVLVVLLFSAHFFALGIYGVTIGLYEMWRFASKQLSVGRNSRHPCRHGSSSVGRLRRHGSGWWPHWRRVDHRLGLACEGPGDHSLDQRLQLHPIAHFIFAPSHILGDRQEASGFCGRRRVGGRWPSDSFLGDADPPVRYSIRS